MAYSLMARAKRAAPVASMPRSKEKSTSGRRAAGARPEFERFSFRLHAAEPPMGGLLQPKLKISEPNDRFEQEADHVADEVMRMSDDTAEEEEKKDLQRMPLQSASARPSISTLNRSLALQFELPNLAPPVQRQEAAQKEDTLQMKFEGTAQAPEAVADLEGHPGSIRDNGKALPDSVRSFFEPRFGCDFSHVRVHADHRAAGLNRSLDARAFTIGQDIFFREAEFNPGILVGRKLLAHELTHVVQQSGHQPCGKNADNRLPILDYLEANGGTFGDAPLSMRAKVTQKEVSSPRLPRGRRLEQVIQRDKPKGKSQETKRRNLYFVIGDKSLNVGGGEFLADLEALKKSLLKTELTGEWTLTLTMHGAETFFGLSAGGVTGGLKEGDPGTYNKSKIQKVFGDKEFEKWRDSHGPTRINLLSCQIGKELEAPFLKLILNPSSSQTAVGLGEGCILYNTPMAATLNNKHIKTRQQYDALSGTDKDIVFKFLEAANNTYGYNGKKVISKDILNYYFDVAPEGLWVKVEVKTKGNHLIPYLGRQQNTTFIDECTPKPLRQRQPAVPQVP